MIATTYRQAEPTPEAVTLHETHVIDGRFMVEFGAGITLYVNAAEAQSLADKFAEIAEHLVSVELERTASGAAA